MHRYGNAVACEATAHPENFPSRNDPEAKLQIAASQGKSRASADDADADVKARQLAREPWVWRKALLAYDHKKLTPTTKFVGMYVAEFFIRRDSHVAFPTYATLAAGCGLKERGVRAAIASLIEHQFIRAKKTRFRGPNELRLCLPDNSQSVTTMPDRGANPSPGCRTNRHHGAAQSVTGVTVDTEVLITNTYTDKKGSADALFDEEEEDDGSPRIPAGDPQPTIATVLSKTYACTPGLIRHYLQRLSSDDRRELFRRATSGSLSAQQAVAFMSNRLGLDVEAELVREAAAYS